MATPTLAKSPLPEFPQHQGSTIADLDRLQRVSRRQRKSQHQQTGERTAQHRAGPAEDAQTSTAITLLELDRPGNKLRFRSLR